MPLALSMYARRRTGAQKRAQIGANRRTPNVRRRAEDCPVGVDHAGLIHERDESAVGVEKCRRKRT